MLSRRLSFLGQPLSQKVLLLGTSSRDRFYVLRYDSLLVPCCYQEGPAGRAGMRWTPGMAEAVVKLRAIYLSGDFDRYWEFHIQQDQQRLYPARWTVVPK